jgi:hypothetical protein
MLRAGVAAAILVGVSGVARNSSAPPPAEATAAPRQAERIALPAPGRRPDAIKSLLNIPGRMEYGQFAWDEKGVPAGPVRVRVDLTAQTISVFRGGHEIGTAVILYGADAKPTPTGDFNVLARLKDHRSSLYDAPMPYTLRLTDDGVAIHGSNVRWGAATHGCVGVPTEFASRLFNVVRVGSPVTITRSDEVTPDQV